MTEKITKSSKKIEESKKEVEKNNIRISGTGKRDVNSNLENNITSVKISKDNIKDERIKRRELENKLEGKKKVKGNVVNNVKLKENVVGNVKVKENMVDNKKTKNVDNIKNDKKIKNDNKEINSENDNVTKIKKYVLKMKKNGRKLKDIVRIYQNSVNVKEIKDYFIIKYIDRKTAMLDIKNEKKDLYVGNKIVVSNFSYKETDESIKDCFKKFGVVEDVQLQKNKDNDFIGKAVITYKGYTNIREDVVLNNKVLRVEKIKNKVFNDKRIFLSRINRNLSILEIRNIFRSCSIKPLDIRIRFLENHQNLGYAHITFKNRPSALEFEENFNKMKDKLGVNCTYEYSVEKKNSNKIKSKK